MGHENSLHYRVVKKDQPTYILLGTWADPVIYHTPYSYI